MNKSLAGLGSCIIFISFILPWYSIEAPLINLDVNLLDIEPLVRGVGISGTNIYFRLPPEYSNFYYLIIGGGILGIISAIIGARRPI